MTATNLVRLGRTAASSANVTRRLRNLVPTLALLASLRASAVWIQQRRLRPNEPDLVAPEANASLLDNEIAKTGIDMCVVP